MNKTLAWISISGAAACSDSQEAATVDLPVLTESAAIAPATTNLGWTVNLDSMRIAVSTIELTIEGEVHQDGARVVAPHPGHEAGGSVTGELPGDFILTWDGAVHPALGDATLLVGDYHGANWSFRAASAADGLEVGDPLIGHTFHLTGTVAKDAVTKPFDAVLDVEPATRLVGAVFEDVIAAGATTPLTIEFYPTDPNEQDTAFDDLDFATLSDVSGTLQIRPGTPAHNVLRRTIQTHDHYGVVPK